MYKRVNFSLSGWVGVGGGGGGRGGGGVGGGEGGSGIPIPGPDFFVLKYQTAKLLEPYTKFYILTQNTAVYTCKFGNKVQFI